MPPDATCPECGTALGADAPEGLCPACLLRHVVESAAPSGFPEGVRLRYVGDYELVEEIGRGAMGVVFRARQLSLGREVAVKLLLGGAWASELAVERFRAEARAAAALRHPGIVAIHEIGEHEGQPYFSMDLVAGHDLGEELRVGALEPHHAAEIVAALAEAVDFAHERGILHRDLKPSNVLIDRAGRPLITDFGLAKNLDAAGGLTVTGQMLGTPGYMSPEQAQGSGGSGLDRRADVYSLGAILYALLTGRAPFAAEGPVETALAQLSSEPTPPRQLRPEVARDLEAICLKCLERAPERRYTTAWDLAADLRAFLAGRPVSARRVAPWTAGWRWCRRHPSVIVLGLILIAALVVWGRVRLRSGGEAAPAPLRATTPPGLERASSFPIMLTAAVSFSADGRRLAIRGLDPTREQTLEVFDVAEGRSVERLAERGAPGLQLADLPSDRRLPVLMSEVDGQPLIRIWSPVVGEIVSLEPAGQLSKSWESDRWLLSPGGSRWVCGSRSQQDRLSVWNPATHDLETLPAKGRPLAFLGEDELLYQQASILYAWSFSAENNRTPVPARPTVALSRDGGTAVLHGERQSTLEVWNVRSGERIAIVPDTVELGGRQALLSPDGSQLALGGSEDPKGLRVWHTAVPELGACVMKLDSRRTVMLSFAAFSPDGLLLAALGDNLGSGAVWVWDAHTGEQVTLLKNQHNPVWNPAGGWLATEGEGRPDPRSPRVVFESKLRMMGMEISGGAVNLWRVTPPAPALSLPTRPVRRLVWNRTGDLLAANGFLSEVKGAAAPILRPRLAIDGAEGVLFDEAGRTWSIDLAETGFDKGLQPLKIEQIEPRRHEIEMQPPEPSEGAIAPERTVATDALLHPDGKSLIVAVRVGQEVPGQARPSWTGGVLERWDLETGRRNVLWRDEKAGALWTGVLATSPDGAIFALGVFAGQGEQGLSLWDWASGEPRQKLLHPWPGAVVFSRDGRTVISGGFSGQIEATVLATGEHRAWSAGQGELLSLAISSDGRLLASGGMDAKIVVWDLATTKPLAGWPAHEERVTALAFHPRERLLASGGADGVVRLWDLGAMMPEP